MRILAEFRTFIQRGNVIDLAVGVIMGVAFGNIVNALVGGRLMPPLGRAAGGVNFTDLVVNLGGTNDKGEPVLLKYGNFLQTLFDFAIVAVCVFALVKLVNALKRPGQSPPPEP